LAVLEKAAAQLPAIPVVRARRGHIARGTIRTTNPEDFRRVSNIQQVQQSGVRLMSDGTAVINVPALETEFKSNPFLRKVFDFGGGLKRKLVQSGGREEGKDRVRIQLPSGAPAGAAIAHPVCPSAAVPVPAAVPAPPHMSLPVQLKAGYAPPQQKIEVPTSGSSIGTGNEAPSLYSSMQGGVDWAQVGASCGFAFLGGFVMAIVDEILCALIPDEKMLKWVRRVVNGLALLIGLGLLISAIIATAPVSVPTLIASILLGIIPSLLGAVAGKLFCKGVKALYQYIFRSRTIPVPVDVPADNTRPFPLIKLIFLICPLFQLTSVAREVSGSRLENV